MNTQKLTVDILLDDYDNDYYEAIKYAESKKLKVEVSRPIKPILNSKHTSEDIKKYSELFSVYETEMVRYNNAHDCVNAHNAEIYSIIEKYIKESSGLKNIPEQYREKVWSKAWEDGHSDGYYSVAQKLSNLLEIFN